ncbi:hypothetical protein MX652_16130, partial [Thauera aromatica]|nr:hypothetical protein [Thauera aromatica]
RTAHAQAVEGALRESAVALGYLKPRCVATTPLGERLLYWGDETAIRQDSHWVRGYSMAGLTPELRLPAGPRGIALE